MDEAEFSEVTTWKRREGLPYDGHSSQTKLCNDPRLSSENDVLEVLDQIRSAVEDPQEEATCKETCRNADTALSLDKMNENAIKKNYGKEQQRTTNPHVPARGDLPMSNISDILQHHLSNEEFLKGQGIDCETLPEISNADSSDEAVVKNDILRCIKSSWPEEQTSDLTGQLNPERDDERDARPSCSPTSTEEGTSELEEPVAAGRGSHPESSNFLTETESRSHKEKRCQGQTPQNKQTQKTRAGHGFKHDQVHCWFSDFSDVAPKGKIPQNDIIDKPLPTDKQASFSPELRDRLALVRDILESLSGPNCVEKEEQKRKTLDPPWHTEVEPTWRICQEHLTGTESETSVCKLTSTSQKDPPSSSSYIFQKISQGKKMCRKLREQTDQLKSKVQEFSKSMAQDSPCHVQDKRLVLEELQGHLELLEQEFVANKEKHLTLKQQIHEHGPPAASDFDPERKAESEILRWETLLEEVEEKIHEGKHTSASSHPVSPPSVLADLPLTPAPPSNEQDPHSTSGRQEREERAEITPQSCVFCHRVLEWKQNMEKKGLRRINCGRFPIALQEQTPHPDSIRKFHYRYNTPGQNFSNHGEQSAFVQLRFLNENKNSSPSCSKPNWIYFKTPNSQSSQDEHERIPGKNSLAAFTTYSSDLASSSPHFHSCRISGSKSSGHFSSTKETKFEGLNSSLDNALRTAIVLKETTDRMIRTIAEDLAKVQRWRNRLKY